MSASVQRLLCRRGACALVMAIVCAFVVGCGSSSQSSSAQTSSGSSSTTAQTARTTTTSTTTSPEADVSGKLDTLPEATPATGTLPVAPTAPTAAAERAYLTAVFNDARHFWQREFSEAGVQYAPARLTLFVSTVHSGRGTQADVGPFYCPANRGVYLDLSFFELLAGQAGIGRFGPAYIVGHELDLSDALGDGPRRRRRLSAARRGPRGRQRALDARLSGAASALAHHRL